MVEGGSAESLLDGYAARGAASAPGGAVQGHFNYRSGRQMSQATKDQIATIWQHNAGFGAFQQLANAPGLAPSAFEDYLEASTLREELKQAIRQLVAADTGPQGGGGGPSPQPMETDQNRSRRCRGRVVSKERSRTPAGSRASSRKHPITWSTGS